MSSVAFGVIKILVVVLTENLVKFTMSSVAFGVIKILVVVIGNL